MNDGVKIVLERMETHPEEFHKTCDKWKFIYQDYFRDSMTETEKGMIFDKLKQIRREEMTFMVMATLTADDLLEDDDDPFNIKTVGTRGNAYDLRGRKTK